MQRAFLDSTNDRSLPQDYAGDVLVWDIDKTYLDTAFSSLKGLVAIPFEAAVDKSSLPGSVKLIRALRHGPDRESAIVPLYFVSGSPPQLRRIIERKMILDGVEFDGITFKDQWGLLRAGRPRAIKEQVGYKMQALLRYRRELPDGARYLMFGDDAERDAESFLLFGEVCEGLRGEALRARLEKDRVGKPDTEEVLRLADSVPITKNPVERIFINVTGDRIPEKLNDPQVVCARSYLQTAMVLAEMERIRKEVVAAVAKDLRRRLVTEASIAEQIVDAEQRLGVSREVVLLARP